MTFTRALFGSCATRIRMTYRRFDVQPTLLTSCFPGGLCASVSSVSASGGCSVRKGLIDAG